MSKTILITGASSGFGRDTAETLFRAGHTVYASMRGAQGKNREAASALRKLGIKTVELDVSDDASVEAGVEKVLVEAGKIDVLINNAGIGSAGVTEAFTAEQAKAIFDTNVIGLLRGTPGRIPDALSTSLTSTFEGEDAPNPHDVAEAIAELVGQAKGSRAVRTVVGAPFGSDEANEGVAPAQAKAVEALGLSHLERVA